MTDLAQRATIARQLERPSLEGGAAPQWASITVLTNRPLRSGWADDEAAPALPLSRGLKLYVEGVDAEITAGYGEVATTPEEADVAILRLRAPFEQPETMFENLFHAGSLEYPAEVIDHIQRIAGTVPTVVDVVTDRPAILEPIIECAVAVTVNGGASARALLDVLTGAAAPQGRLPFDLPRSMAAVAASRPEVPFDTVEPLFRLGHGVQL
jgi:beta-glucosidase